MVRERRREQLNVTVPGYFRCPISMDVMKSPVSLCTGVTYDRSSIEKWLSLGHKTCPATMQSLPSTTTTPNLTLRRLIQLWLSQSDFGVVSSPFDFESVNIDSLSKLISFMRVSEGNLKFVAVSEHVVEKLVDVFVMTEDIRVRELIIEALELVLTENKVREKFYKLISSGSLFLTSLVSVLQKGNVESKVKCAKILEKVAVNNDEFKTKIGENKVLLHEVYELCNVDNDLSLVTVGLSVLTAVSSSRPVKKDLIRFGLVKTVVKILSNDSSNRAVIIEKAVQVLESVATCTEGRSAICENEECVVGIVKRLMKCSRVATEHGITVLWSVCCLARDSIAQENVVRVNGLTKVLVVMQSDCSTSAKMMCGELVKVLRVKNGKSNLAPYYETKTIHITPY